nr:hypothetical protein [Oleomonas cavernae]
MDEHNVKIAKGSRFEHSAELWTLSVHAARSRFDKFRDYCPALRQTIARDLAALVGD